MNAPNAFWPDTLIEWLTLFGILATWIVATWRVYVTLVNKMNGLGGRVEVLEGYKTENRTRIEHLETGHQIATSDRANLHERMGRLEKSNEGLAEQITELKLDVIGHINEVKSMIREDVAALRERTVRLEVHHEQQGKKNG